MKRTVYSSVLVAILLVFGGVSQAVAADGGGLYMTSGSQMRTVGESFTVQVRASTHGQTVNAIEGELAYDPSTLSVEDISTDHSILTSWATVPHYDSAQGLIRFSGWAGQPFAGTDGLLLTITFRPLRVGQSSVDFNSGAMLAADAQGSNIITSMQSSVFRIQPVQTQVVAPEPASIASSTAVPTTTTNDSGPASSASTSVSPAPQAQIAGQSSAAALLLSGVELAPLLLPGMAFLVCIAFGIAYVLHRITRRSYLRKEDR